MTEISHNQERAGGLGHRGDCRHGSAWLIVALLVGILTGGFGAAAPAAGQEARTIS
ncbi:MAG: hypothetical protein H0W06_12900, partial [Chloroflexia bacterium]|nr:hypothetical protein [Chloroflexia bacterium]